MLTTFLGVVHTLTAGAQAPFASAPAAKRPMISMPVSLRGAKSGQSMSTDGKGSLVVDVLSSTLTCEIRILKNIADQYRHQPVVRLTSISDPWKGWKRVQAHPLAAPKKRAYTSKRQATKAAGLFRELTSWRLNYATVSESFHGSRSTVLQIGNCNDLSLVTVSRGAPDPNGHDTAGGLSDSAEIQRLKWLFVGSTVHLDALSVVVYRRTPDVSGSRPQCGCIKAAVSRQLRL